MTLILRLLLLSTLFVSCLSAPKFHLIETEDDGGVVDGERGVDRWGGWESSAEDDDYL